MPQPTPTAPAADVGAPDPVVSITGLRKSFRREDGTIVRAIDDVSLEVAQGEFVVLLGPSGCGKTTLLRSVAGLERPDEGSIVISGRSVFDAAAGVEVAPERRRLSMIFQSYALWPHMTAFGNVAYPLQSRKDVRMSKTEVGERVRRVLGLVGIPELEGQYPNQMSGGQQQRVALARSLVAGDDLILFDEPLSNVDAKVREQLRIELVTMQAELGFSAVFVTHDQVEAMELADRIAVLDTGRVVQYAPPREIYQRPSTRYVADFIGTTNEIAGTISSCAGGQAVVDTSLGPVTGVPGQDGLAHGQEVSALWRPERCILGSDLPLDGPNRWRGIVRAALFVGSHTEHVIEVEHGDTRLQVRTWSTDEGDLQVGTPVTVGVRPEHIRILGSADDAGV